MAARLDVALAGAIPVRCLCDDARGYGVIYDNRELIGADVIIIAPDVSQPLPQYRFTSRTPLAPIAIHHAGQQLLSLSVTLGISLSTTKP